MNEKLVGQQDHANERTIPVESQHTDERWQQNPVYANREQIVAAAAAAHSDVAAACAAVGRKCLSNVSKWSQQSQAHPVCVCVWIDKMRDRTIENTRVVLNQV